ncbi:hypothetical protein MMC20_000809 [Loxospora ochrophaea]|nr:hypothetical protein [Loxospora ochrophaea]
MARQPTPVLVLLYPGFNILDFAAPVEVFSKAKVSVQEDGKGQKIYSPSSSSIFDLTVAAQKEHTQATEGARVHRDVALADARASLERFDVLVVPGGRSKEVLDLCRDDAGKPLRDLIAAFVALPKREEGRERALISICTASLILGHLGILAGKKATTHWMDIESLKNITATSGRDSTEVVSARFVDAGSDTNKGLRLITAGGVSCGLDGCLYFVELKTNREVAENIAHILDYSWRREEGIICQ